MPSGGNRPDGVHHCSFFHRLLLAVSVTLGRRHIPHHMGVVVPHGFARGGQRRDCRRFRHYRYRTVSVPRTPLHPAILRVLIPANGFLMLAVLPLYPTLNHSFLCFQGSLCAFGPALNHIDLKIIKLGLHLLKVEFGQGVTR